MVYIPGNQTAQYPKLGSGPVDYTTTKQHFHDDPSKKEPKKASTFATLYDNSVYFMAKRLEKRPINSHETTIKMGSDPAKLTWTGRLPAASYVGNGTFQLANSLTYSCKPVKLVPYNDLMRSEYQDKFNKTTSSYKGYSLLNRSTNRWKGQ